jgi:methylenetetrahydrofolate dehydrogenase (NADP+)/methenyltetrahydrofolate cyclohydrolase
MLAVVLVGDNPASRSYIRMKEKRAREIGMAFGVYTYPVDISQHDLEKEVRTL